VSPEFAAIAEKSEKALAEFLRAEVALGLTYAQTAKVEAGFDAAGEKRARELANDAVITIHWFRNRITDSSIQLEMQESADRIKKLLLELLGASNRRSKTHCNNVVR
jgi:hypothetical protein